MEISMKAEPECESEADLPEDLCVWDVDGMDPEQALALAKKLGIEDISDFITLNLQLKLVITQRIRRIRPWQMLNSDQLNEHIQLQIVEDKSRRILLHNYLNDLIEVATHIDIMRILKFDPTLGNVMEQPDPLLNRICTVRPNFLRRLFDLWKIRSPRRNCPILISGETGSGKSSFINLLLNMDIMPTSMLSDTSTFIHIRYDENLRAEFFNENDDLVATLELGENESCEEFSKRLKPYISDCDQRIMRFRYCNLYCNSAILQNGLELVDSMGFGDTLDFDEKLKEFHKNARGYIYILKKNNPIGDSQTGGLIPYLSHLSGPLLGKHHGSVLFLINMWDTLDVETNDRAEKQRIYDYVVHNLQVHWPQLSPEKQVIRMSVRDSAYMQRHQVISEDYSQVLAAIQNLWINSLNNETLQLYGEMQSFVEIVMDTLNTVIQPKHDAAINEWLKELDNLEDFENKFHLFVKRQERLLDSKQHYCENEITMYLKSEEFESLLMGAVMQSRNGISITRMKIADINSEIQAIAIDKINSLLDDFLTRNKLFQTIGETFLNAFREQLQLCNTVKRLVQYQQTMEQESSEAAPCLVVEPDPFELNGLTAAPPLAESSIVMLTYKKKTGLLAHFDYRDLKSFYKENVKYVNKTTKKVLLSVISNHRQMSEFVRQHLHLIKQRIHIMRDSVIKNILFLRSTVSMLAEEFDSQTQLQGFYAIIRQKMEDIQKMLRKFNIFYLERYKRNTFLLNVLLDGQEDCPAEAPQVTLPPLCWALDMQLFSGRLKNMTDWNEQPDNRISVMEFLCKDNLDEVVNRITLFCDSREKMPSPVSKNFLKILYFVKHLIDEPEIRCPWVCMEPVQCSLRFFVAQKCPPISWPRNSHPSHSSLTQMERERFYFLLESFQRVLQGLHYLHSHDLVHLNLSLDSIAVTPNGMVKLTTLRKPVYLQDLDQNKISAEYVLQWSCFSRECLSPPPFRDMYDPMNEIFSFGFLLYEAWTGIPAFQQELLQPHNTIVTLTAFREKLFLEELEPNMLLFHGDDAQAATKPTIYAQNIGQLLEMCWFRDTKRRPDAQTIFDAMQHMLQADSERAESFPSTVSAMTAF